MPLLNGADAAREIAQVCPGTRSILLTMCQDEDQILNALLSGVKGCVQKSFRASDLIEAIREVLRGGVYLSPQLSAKLVDAYRSRQPAPADPLSQRERQVLQLIAEGKKTRDIASLLGVSVKTAESHRTRIMKKLGHRHTAGLVRYAIQRGLSAL
jgi:DNA-binding NarL/FixJ family response regulator